MNEYLTIGVVGLIAPVLEHFFKTSAFLLFVVGLILLGVGVIAL